MFYRSFGLLSLLLAALAWAALAGARSPAADPSAHLLLVPDTASGEAALARTDARVVARYESFSLVEAVGSDEERLRRAGADRRDDMRTVTTAAGEVDPRSERRSLAGKGAPDRDETLALVQFVGPPKDVWLERLRATGARIVTYQAENAYVVHARGNAVDRLAGLMGADPAVRAVGVLTAADKVEPGGTGEFAVSSVAGSAGAEVRDEATAQAGSVLGASSTVGALRTQYLSLSGAEVAELARDPAVVAIEPYAEPELADERAAQIVAGNLTGSFEPSGPGYRDWLVPAHVPDESNFDFAIDVTDEGLDNGANPPAHSDFRELGSGASRVAYLNNYTGDSNARDCGGHGTNVASIAAGYNNGTGAPDEEAAGFNYGMGVAPFARLGASKIFTCAGAFSLGGTVTSLAQAAYAGGARISNNSWGTGGPVWGSYTARARDYDALVRDASAAAGNQELVEVFAAGNDGDDNGGSFNEGYGTILAEGTAKNGITVGAAEGVRPSGTDGCNTTNSSANSARDIVNFSSRGPTDDGRLKPDLVAPGTHITGARPAHAGYTGAGTCTPIFAGTLYSLVSGSSQATPQVSGAAALVRDWYERTEGVPPSAALVKALLINTATDLAGGQNGKGDTIAPGPNTDQGWGRVNVGNALDSTGREYRDQAPADLFSSSGESVVHGYEVADPDKPVRVTLVWTDPPGPPAGDAFVNNLDLEVSAGGRTYKGNVFEGANSRTGGDADTRNNVESVYLPAGTSGRVAVKVVGTNVAGDGVPGDPDITDQDFALIVSNANEQPAPLLVHESTTIDDVTPPGDGDQALESDEHVSLNEQIRNAGTDPATGLTATLQGGGELSVTQAVSTYADLPSGDTATNVVPFEVELSNAAICGQDVPATLEIASTSPAETQTVPLVLPTGTAGAAQTHSSSTPVAIPDDSAAGVSSSVFVAERGRIKDVDVTLGTPSDPGIDHTWVGDLVIDLTGPDGTTVRLADHPGGPDNDGEDFAGTTFDDAAPQSISEGVAPYDGSFRPQNDQLSRFDGKSRRGTWTLRVRDLFEGDTGTLNAWGVRSQKALCDVDTVPPDTTITSAPASQVSSSSPTFGFDSDDGTASFECKLDSAPYEPCVSTKSYAGVSDGPHTFQVRAVDGSDNEDGNPAMYSWVVDTTPPDTVIAAGPSGFVASRNASIAFSSEPGASFECRLDGAAFVPCSSPQPYGGLADGSHSFQVRARDTLANLESSPATASWTVDTVAPRPAVTSPAASSTTTDQTPLLGGVAGTAAGDEGVVTVKLFSGTLAAGLPAQTYVVARDGGSGAWSAQAGALANGTYTVTVEQGDAAGNRATSATSSFRVTTAPPPPPPPSPPPAFVVAPVEASLADAVAGRVTALAACASACQASAKLTVSSRVARGLGMKARPVSLGSGARRLAAAGAAAVRVRLSAAARAALRRRTLIRGRLQVTIKEGATKLSFARGISLRRSAGLRRIASRGLRLWAGSAESYPLIATLEVSPTQARRLGLKTNGSAPVEIATGRTTAARKPVALTLKVRRSARAVFARARHVRAQLEAVPGTKPGEQRSATLQMKLRR